MDIKHLAFTFELKEADDATRTVEGYASIFNNVDSYKDIVMPGAFTRTLKGKKSLPMLWQHDSGDVIGKWDQLEEQDKGLYVKGSIIDTTCGLDAYKLVKAGAVTGMSIGYATKNYEIDTDKDIRKLLEIDLYEVSLVTFPANERAQVTRVKSFEEVQIENLHEHKRAIEAALRDAGVSNSVADYIGALIPTPALRDAGGEVKATRELAQMFNQFKL